MKWLFIAAVLVAISFIVRAGRAWAALAPRLMHFLRTTRCALAFEDPQVPGIVCHISQARKGGWGQPLGLNEDASNFSVVCRQIGPINIAYQSYVKMKRCLVRKQVFFSSNSYLSLAR